VMRVLMVIDVILKPISKATVAALLKSITPSLLLHRP
jgi:hypothetical protein